MNMNQALAWTDRLLTGLSHNYEIDYRDESGAVYTCTYSPGESLSACSLQGWPDELELQQAVVNRLQVAIAEDAADSHLVLSSDEQSAVEALEYTTLDSRAPDDYGDGSFGELVEAWESEDAEENDAEDRAEARRAIVAEFQSLAPRAAMLQRHGFGPMLSELSNMLAGDADEFNPARAESLLCSLQSGASAPCGNYR